MTPPSPLPRSLILSAIQSVMAVRPICTASNPAEALGRFWEGDHYGQWPRHPDAKIIGREKGSVVKRCPHCGYRWKEMLVR